jgi:hypothetical protein
VQNPGGKVSIRGFRGTKLDFYASIRAKIRFFHLSAMTRLFSGLESVEIVFTDIDLGGLCAKSWRKSKFPSLHIGKIEFLGLYIGKNPVFSHVWHDPIFFRSRKCRNRVY